MGFKILLIDDPRMVGERNWRQAAVLDGQASEIEAENVARDEILVVPVDNSKDMYEPAGHS